MNRKEIRDDIKLSFGLDMDKEDGGMSDAQFNIAIHNALKIVAKDCKACFVEKSFPLRQGQYQYPLDPDVDIIRAVWFLDSQGMRNELRWLPPERFMEGLQSETDISNTPTVFSYPIMQRAVIHFWAQAPPIYDYVSLSYVTEGTIRTLVDKGANFGQTLSGYRIEPGAVVRNLTDNSFGYVQALNISTEKAKGFADANSTTTQLWDVSKNFTALGVYPGDIICNPWSVIPASYGFVTEVYVNYLVYENMQGEKLRIRPNDPYRVGTATEIVLSGSIPHPGLRDGVTNKFNVSASKATITNTVFEFTKVTGSIAILTTAPEAGDTVIADTGQHAQVEAVYENYLTVDRWIGGMPNANTICSVKKCDQYQIETKGLRQRVFSIAPTPDFSDTAGSASIIMLYNKVPDLPDDDNDRLEIDDRYRPLLIKCASWQAQRLSGIYTNNPAHLTFLEQEYRTSMNDYSLDSQAPPASTPLSVWDNRMGRGVSGGRFEGASGLRYILGR
jgi:hypothetical protein